MYSGPPIIATMVPFCEERERERFILTSWTLLAPQNLRACELFQQSHWYLHEQKVRTIKSLKKLGRVGMTTLFTPHQPISVIFEFAKFKARECKI